MSVFGVPSIKPDQIPIYVVISIVTSITVFFSFYKKVLFHAVHFPCRLGTPAKKGGAVSGEFKNI